MSTSPACPQPLGEPFTWSYLETSQLWHGTPNIKADWYSARDYCKSYGMSIELATVYDYEENQAIQENSWLAGFSETPADSESWYWVHNQHQNLDFIKFSNWDVNQPSMNSNNKCLSTNKLWSNANCNEMKLFTCEYRCPEIDPNDIDPTIDPTAEPQSDYILGDLLFSTDNNTWMQTVQGNDPIGNFSVPATFQLSFDFKFNDLSSNHAVFRIDYQLPEIWLGIQDTSNRRNTNDTWGNIYSYLDQGYSTYAYSYLYRVFIGIRHNSI